MSKYKKRPLGLMPEKRYEELKTWERIEQIYAAMSRYRAEGYDIPQKWHDELKRRKDHLIKSGDGPDQQQIERWRSMDA